MKTCKNPQCPNINPQSLENFYKDTGLKDGHANRCKTCKNAQTLESRKKNPPVYNGYMKRWRAKNPDRQHATEIKRHYGLTIERYNEMLAEQKFGCKICGKQHDAFKKRGKLYVDHIKGTKIVRGLLCGACNSGIGYFLHDIEILQKAIAYLMNSIKLTVLGDA